MGQQRAEDTIVSDETTPQNEERISVESSKQDLVPVAAVQIPSEEEVAIANIDVPTEVQSPSRSSSSAVHMRKDTRTAIPKVPALPNIAGSRQKPATSASSEKNPTSVAPVSDDKSAIVPVDPVETAESQSPAATPQPTKAIAKSWADLVRTKGNNAAGVPLTNGSAVTNGAQQSRAGSLAEALSHFQVDSDEKVAFLEPRGLVNTGNMCYMNSVCRNSASDMTVTTLLTLYTDASSSCILCTIF